MVHAAERTSPRMNHAGALLAAILVATLLGLVYLTQTLGSAATHHEIERLLDERDQLIRDLYTQKSRVAQNRSVIAQRATQAGLVQLGDPRIVPEP
jgi:hypothetical protein